MCAADISPETAQLARELHAEWLGEWGGVLHGESLQKAMGFSSLDALSKAIRRGQLPLPFFSMPKRRGHFVLTREAACYVARQRAEAGDSCKVEPSGQKEDSSMT